MTRPLPTTPAAPQPDQAVTAAADQAQLEADNAAAGNPTPGSPQDPAAAPTLTAGQEAILNEDWTKLPSWDVTDANGDPVTTLDQLVEVLDLGDDRAAAARELLASPASAAAPPELLAEAQAEVDPDAALEGWVGPDGQHSLPPAGGLDDTEQGDPAAAEDAADGGADDDVEDPQGNPFTKAFPWQKGGKDKGSADTGSSTRKATIAAGAFVSGNFGKGKVEVVVTSGKVPGVDTDVEGSKDAPACRVRVYEESDGSWKATDKRVAVKASGLKTIPPLGAARFGKKSAAASLVLLAAEAKQLPAEQRPTAEAIRTVYQRGLNAYPEGKAAISREEWGLGRARAFLELCQGIDTLGYVGDLDQVP